MKSIKVALHCHSAHSDGILFPDQLARQISEAGVKYASLTDHNTIVGLAAFKKALMSYGIGFISGAEFTTIHKSHVIHILAYGFDLNDPGLNALLNDKNGAKKEASISVMHKVCGTAAEVITVIHRAGGIAILAHPFQTIPDYKHLRIILNELQKLGLDGVEAIYEPNSQETQRHLLEIAAEGKFIVSAGTDFHHPEESSPGIVITDEQWKQFRNALLKNSLNPVDESALPAPPLKPKNNWFSLLKNIYLPAVMTLTLFIIALFLILLPYFEETLLERKRDSIKQLTQVAWGVLNEAAEEADHGHLSLDQAQALAKNRIAAMRYGQDNRDYFWIQDLTPRILMHPYRTDLNNQDVSDFQDAKGTKIFVAFADLVKEKGEGFISYVWQWMDEKDRMEPKESYIRIFEPWGWLIGTGIYVYDVQAEIANLRNHIVKMSLVIIFLVLLLLIYLVRQGLILEHSRKEAEMLLIESVERYKTLSEAATEGALFVYDNRCRYANTVMYEFLGCSSENIELLDLTDVFPEVEINMRWLSHFPNINNGEFPNPAEGVLRRCDGTNLCCTLTFRGEFNNPKSGCMILVRRSIDITEHTGTHIALNRLLHIPNSIAEDITESIKNAKFVSEVISLRKKTNSMVLSLLENGTSSIAITSMLSTIADVTVLKMMELCYRELGQPPVPFTFLALGSHGRQAQTMFSDQDNAIIYKPEQKSIDNKTETYFLRLGTMLCDLLEQTGYKKCPGQKNASNPQWCQPLHIWKAYFDEWIRNCEPQQVVEFSIFFDFRPVAGDAELATELRSHVHSLLKETPFFLSQLAQNALLFKTPIRVLGSIVTSSSKKHPGRIDIKSPAMAIVSFVRLNALKHNILETNTISRIDDLKKLGIMLESKQRDIVTAYETLMKMRLWNQLHAIENNLDSDNWIDPGQLGHLEELILRECFKEIDDLHSLIQKDFLA
ncbi:MAG: cache domain-containing protein [Candidatus Cloacimonetes bacterium]|nr:cache domain-containing protein [Candidatus Cloacimonadota bacterium]